MAARGSRAYSECVAASPRARISQQRQPAMNTASGCGENGDCVIGGPTSARADAAINPDVNTAPTRYVAAWTVSVVAPGAAARRPSTARCTRAAATVAARTASAAHQSAGYGTPIAVPPTISTSAIDV